LKLMACHLKAVLSNGELVLNSYRRAVSNQIPKATRIAWTLKKDEIQKSVPGITKNKFLFNLSPASYEKKWGRNYQRPSFGEKFLTFLSKLLPKIGPLRVFEFRMPTPQAEKLFEESFNTTLSRYRTLLSDEGSGQLALTNENFDTGGITGPGKYRMNDEAHAKLLNELSKQSFSRLLKNRAGRAISSFGVSHSGAFECLSRDFSCYRAPERSVSAPFRDTTARTYYVGTTLRIRFRMRTRL